MKIVNSARGRKLLVVGVSAACVATLAPVAGNASSHREAPLVAGTPSLDNTDLYAFVSPDAPETVTVVANWQPFSEPDGGPNFYPFAEQTAHDVNIDNDGDAKADIVYRWTFATTYQNEDTFLYNTGPVTSLTDPDLNVRQTYTLQRITSGGSKTLLKKAKVAPSFTGKASMPDYAALSNAAVTPIAYGGKSFAGQADDAFFADLRVFDLLYGANLSEVGQDTLKGYNVNSIALQVPKRDLALKANVTRNPVVGIWTTTSRVGASMKAKHGAKLTQVSRLGMPLVNEVVIPLAKKNAFNASRPEKDAQFLKYVQKPEVPKLIQAIYGIPAPKEPRADLVEVFLTGVCVACGPVKADLNSQLLNKDVKAKKFAPSEQLRLNLAVPPTAVPNRLGVLGGDLAGFPNGRRLADDVIDVTLRAAEGALLPNPHPAVATLGDKVDANEHAFRGVFPYVALPNMVAVNQS
jgi:hypothetical protein